jgi:hypothetical protein
MKAKRIVFGTIAIAVLLAIAADDALVGTSYFPQKWHDAPDKPLAEGRVLECHYLDLGKIGSLGRKPLTNIDLYWPGKAQQVILPAGEMVSPERIGIKNCPWARGWKAQTGLLTAAGEFYRDMVFGRN